MVAPYGLTWEELDPNENSGESYLYEGNKDETQEANIDLDESRLFLTIKE